MRGTPEETRANILIRVFFPSLLPALTSSMTRNTRRTYYETGPDTTKTVSDFFRCPTRSDRYNKDCWQANRRDKWEPVPWWVEELRGFGMCVCVFFFKSPSLILCFHVLPKNPNGPDVCVGGTYVEACASAKWNFPKQGYTVATLRWIMVPHREAFYYTGSSTSNKHVVTRFGPERKILHIHERILSVPRKNNERMDNIWQGATCTTAHNTREANTCPEDKISDISMRLID